MSFRVYQDRTKVDDTVILYLKYHYMMPLKLQAGGVHQTCYGALRHDDVIGKRFGSKIPCSKGYLYVLHPTAELWTVNLPHRTQILYTPDISMVLFQLDLQPGSVVVESGTGSGSLSHAIIRTIAPKGHLYTFDFHEQRVEKIKQEFKEHDVGDLATVRQRDVCSDGFDLEDVADAVFLDLPKPWLAIPSAKKSMKPSGGRICCFSPCIEQVQNTCEELNNNGFTDLSTMECLLRVFDPRAINLPIADIGDKGSADTNSQDKKMQKVKETDDKMEKKDSKNARGKNDFRDRPGRDFGPCYSFTTAAPPEKMPGHTGYLTFASLPPV
ncbi:tRNA (adenine(58)-N(1))-methyltransferase catalytic subunit TRMT61A-like [Lineus longissimus]|uniref:tRNA (adenine(58)-N(1))-methyltransferase catalytic subunit TRMT61A-like n=1 Tax=Lineus longissimus TaxID=88925 RepID=UPI002B4CD717